MSYSISENLAMSLRYMNAHCSISRTCSSSRFASSKSYSQGAHSHTGGIQDLVKGGLKKQCSLSHHCPKFLSHQLSPSDNNVNLLKENAELKNNLSADTSKLKSPTDPEKIQLISKLEETVFTNIFHRKKSQMQDGIIKIIRNEHGQPVSLVQNWILELHSVLHSDKASSSTAICNSAKSPAAAVSCCQGSMSSKQSNPT